MKLLDWACRYVWGLRTDVKDNVQVVSDTMIVIPAGHNVVINNFDTHQQQFIQPPADSEGITGLAITPNQRHIAVTERAEKPTVTIYDLQTLKRRKVLSSVEIGGKVSDLQPSASQGAPIPTDHGP